MHKELFLAEIKEKHQSNIIRIFFSHLVDPPALDAQGVLVHCDHFPVEQNGLVVWLDGAQVHGHEQRSGKNGPQRHLGFALLITEAEVANYQL